MNHFDPKDYYEGNPEICKYCGEHKGNKKICPGCGEPKGVKNEQR